MPLLLVNAKEVGDEVHTIGEVSPILCAALLQAIRSHVYARQHFSQPRIVDLLEHLWKCSRQISSQAKYLGAGQIEAERRRAYVTLDWQLESRALGRCKTQSCIEKFEPKPFPRALALSLTGGFPLPYLARS